MGGSLKLSWIIVLVFLLIRPVVNGEERKYENRKVKELGPACDENECQVECDNDGYYKGRCFRDACVCFETTEEVESEEAEKREEVESARKMDFLAGNVPTTSATAHHNHYPPQLN